MTYRKALILTTSLFAATALACNTFGGLFEGDGPTSATPAPLSTGSVQGPGCGEAALAETSGEPGEPIPIEGLPAAASTADYTVAFNFAEYSEPIEMALVEIGENQIAATTPLHPDGIQGGQAGVNFFSGSEQCFESEFQILAIEPVPGAFAEYSHELIRFFELTRQLYGYDRTELLEDISSLPPHAIPLALVERSFGEGSPPTSSDLNETLAWLVPEAEIEELDQESLDALSAHFGLADQLQRQNDADQELLDQLQGSSASGMLSAPWQVGIQQISSAGALHVAMEKQARCAGESDNPAHDAVDDISEGLESAVDAVIKGVDEGTGLVGKALPTPLKIIEGIRTRQKLLDAACEHLLPGELVSLTASPTIQWFPEDWTGPDGAVPKVTLEAQAEGLNLREQVDQISQLDDNESRELLFDLADEICSFHESCNPDNLEIKPEPFPPVDVTFGDWITAELSGESISLESSPPYLYGPLQRGVSQIEFRTVADNFGSAEPVETSVPIHVEECLENGLNPPEGSYQFERDVSTLTCETPVGTDTITDPPHTEQVQVVHEDEHGCKIQVVTSGGTFEAARIATTPDYSKFSGVGQFGGITCGISLTWDGQSFLGNFDCYAAVGGVGVCYGSTPFTMK